MCEGGAVFVFAGHQCVSSCVRWTSLCERFCGCWGDKLYPLGRAIFPSSAPSAREWRNIRRTTTPHPPPGKNREAERTHSRESRQSLAATPPEPHNGSKGPRVRFYHPSQARKETAVKRQLQHGGREPGLKLR